MKYSVISVLAVLCVYAGLASAHGGTVALDRVVGDYTAHLEFDAIDGMYADVPVQFAFELYGKDGIASVDFTDVWVTIVSSGGAPVTPPVFIGGIIGAKTTLVPAGMTIVFPRDGSYDMKLRYERGDMTLADVTFQLSVLSAKGTVTAYSAKDLTIYFMLGSFCMFLLMIVIRKKLNKSA